MGYHTAIAKKKGHGGFHRPPAPPPSNPPPPVEPPPGPPDPPPGGSSSLNFGSVGRYNPVTHPYTDRAPASAFPTSFLHTQYGYDLAGVSIGAFVDVGPLVNSGNRATNSALLQSAIDTNRVLNQNTRILLPSVFPMFSVDLKEITNAGKWIYIQRQTDPVAEGTRVNPTTLANAPEFMIPLAEETTLYFNRKASRYYIMGCRFVMNPVLNHVYYLLTISPRESSADFDTDIANVNSDIIIDRCLIQGNDAGTGPFIGNVRQGITMNGQRQAVINCYIQQISSSAGEETHGLLMTNSPGPSKFVNNFVECSGIGVLIGGDIPHFGKVAGRPRDIEFRRNFITKRLSWCPTGDTFDGVTGRSAKGLFETKNVIRILIEGNVMDGCWAEGQAGMIVVFKSALGINTPDVTGFASEDVTFRYNVMRNSVRPWNFQGFDDVPEWMKRISAYDNLLYNIGEFQNQRSGTHLITHRSDDLYIRHNTLIHNEFINGALNYDYPQSPRSQRHTFSDNILTTGNPGLGIFMSGGALGANALNAWAENPYFERNIFVGPYDPFIADTLTFATNTVVTDVAAMNFVNVAGFNFRLSATSPGKGAGVGGKDLGADIDKVELATNGVV